MRAEHHRCTIASTASASAEPTTTAASTVISERSPLGIASSRIDRNANGGTSSSRALTKMVSRNTMMIVRYGRANRHRPPHRAALQTCALHRLVVAGQQQCGPIRMRSRIRVRPSDATRLGHTLSPDAASGFDDLLCRAAGRLRRPTRESRRRTPSTPTRRSIRPTIRSAGHRSATTGRVEIGTFTAPIDYNDPSKGTFDLDIARHLALKPEERIGSLLVNPGGPGFGGTDFAVFAEQNFGQQLLDHFDIVAWDPRGTGLSEPAIDCIDDYDHFFATGDITPDDPAERQQLIDLAKEFTDRLRGRRTPRSTSTSAPTTRHATSTPSAPRSARRRSATSDSATAASWAARGRRCSRPPCAPRCSTVRSIPTPDADRGRAAAGQGLRGLAGRRSSRVQRRQRSARSTTAATPPARSTTDEGSIDASPIPSRGGPPARHRGGGADRRWLEAMYSETSWPQLALGARRCAGRRRRRSAGAVRRVLRAPPGRHLRRTRWRRSR